MSLDKEGVDVSRVRVFDAAKPGDEFSRNWNKLVLSNDSPGHAYN